MYERPVSAVETESIGNHLKFGSNHPQMAGVEFRRIGQATAAGDCDRIDLNQVPIIFK